MKGKQVNNLLGAMAGHDVTPVAEMKGKQASSHCLERGPVVNLVQPIYITTLWNTPRVQTGYPTVSRRKIKNDNEE